MRSFTEGDDGFGYVEGARVRERMDNAGNR